MPDGNGVDSVSVKINGGDEIYSSNGGTNPKVIITLDNVCTFEEGDELVTIITYL